MASENIHKQLQPWKVIDRRLIADASPWLKLWQETIQLPDGKVVHDYYTIEQADYVEIFAILDNNKVIGIWHYKHGPRRVTLGLPAGYLEKGETPLDAARRELLEEVGYEADHWTYLGKYANDGNRGAGHAHIYLARDLHQVCEPDSGDLEENIIDHIPVEEIGKYLGSEEIETLGAGAAIALGLYHLFQQNI